MEGRSEREQSAFDSSILYLGRLNGLLYSADKSSIALDLYSWYNILLAFFREISTEMKDREIEEYKKEFTELLPRFQNIARQKEDEKAVYMDYELYNKLADIELKLRVVFKESGLQNKRVEDASYGMR